MGFVRGSIAESASSTNSNGTAFRRFTAYAMQNRIPPPCDRIAEANLL